MSARTYKLRLLCAAVSFYDNSVFLVKVYSVWNKSERNSGLMMSMASNEGENGILHDVRCVIQALSLSVAYLNGNPIKIEM